jgi:hypothetical protein
LTEKHYENFIEVLTNNIIATAASLSNPTLSLPQSSSIFLSLSNQSDISKIEESEIYHNSKGDIADQYNSSSSFIICLSLMLQ